METSNPKTAGRRILVIDDSQDGALTLAMLLKLKGYDVHTRYSGQEGIAAAEQLRPDVVVLDLAMPVMDGYTACQLIREQTWGSDIVLIALSGYSQPADIYKSLTTGFDAHLVKPVDLQDLLLQIDRLLAEKHLN